MQRSAETIGAQLRQQLLQLGRLGVGQGQGAFTSSLGPALQQMLTSPAAAIEGTDAGQQSAAGDQYRQWSHRDAE